MTKLVPELCDDVGEVAPDVGVAFATQLSIPPPVLAVKPRVTNLSSDIARLPSTLYAAVFQRTPKIWRGFLVR
jgi:hypothetical protein